MTVNSLAACAMGEGNRGKEAMVFDWERAARRIVETGAREAFAGLQNDWEWTGGPIWVNGAPVPADETYTYLASTWAIPELRLDGEVEDCYRMAGELPGWDEHTYWPEESLTIVNQGKDG